MKPGNGKFFDLLDISSRHTYMKTHIIMKTVSQYQAQAEEILSDPNTDRAVSHIANVLSSRDDHRSFNHLNWHVKDGAAKLIEALSEMLFENLPDLLSDEQYDNIHTMIAMLRYTEDYWRNDEVDVAEKLDLVKSVYKDL